MLYSLLGCVVVLAFALPILSLYTFKLGVKYGKDKDEAVNTPIIPKKSKAKESEEIKRRNKISQNIDNYVGDSRNQEEF